MLYVGKRVLVWKAQSISNVENLHDDRQEHYMFSYLTANPFW